MLEIHLDASRWKTRDDFYDALLRALGAPEWHGRNLDALNDSIISNDINEIHTPYCIRITGTEGVPQELRGYLKRFAALIEDLANTREAEVAITCQPSL